MVLPWVLVLFCTMQSSIAMDINVLIMLPYQKPSGYRFPFGAELSGAAVKIAMDDIAANGLLTGHTLKPYYRNSHCDFVKGLGITADSIYAKTYHIVIGPQCSHACSHVAKLLAYKNLPAFTGVCQAPEMLNKGIFKTLTRFLGSFTMVGECVIGLMTKFNWKRFGLITDIQEDRIWTWTKSGVESVAVDREINIAASIVIEDSLNKFNEYMTVGEVLKKVASVSRIIVLSVPGGTFRKLLIEAHQQGLLNGEYFFICIFYYRQENNFGDFDWKQGDENDTIVREAHKHVVFIAYYKYETAEYKLFTNRMRNESLKLFNYTYAPNYPIPYPAANLYEAMYMYAVSINETLAAGGNISDGYNVSRRLWGRSFPSITGHLTINSNGDRAQGYLYQQSAHVHDASINTWSFLSVGKYLSESDVFIDDALREVHFPAGAPPLDTPLCGYDGEFCMGLSTEQKMLIGIGSVLGAILLIMAALVGGFFYYKSIMKKRQAEIIWRISYNEILFSRGSATSVSRLSMKSRGSTDHGQIFTKVGTYRGSQVAIKLFQELTPAELERSKKEYYEMTTLINKNVTKILGLCVDSPNFFVVTEYCPKGSLQDILANDAINMDSAFKHSLIWDMLRGLSYLHDSHLKYHSNLKSSNCVVDGRFILKITDFGPKEWLRKKERISKDLLWTAPEILRNPNIATHSILQKSDIYSFSIIMQEIIMRNGTFYLDHGDLTANDIIDKVLKEGQTTAFRPSLDDEHCVTAQMMRLIVSCWQEDPMLRPSLKLMKSEMKEINPGAQNFMDNLLERMEQYAENLESLVEERTGKYLQEKKRVEELLHTILPPVIADQLQTKGFVEPVSYESVTILFTDIKGFTNLSSASTPIQIVNMLNDLYTLFDGIIATFDAYKVETIGDAYMVVSGLPNICSDHASQIADLTLNLMVGVKTFRIRHRPDVPLLLRAGIHTGSCVAGVVGLTMPRYCLFGDTVNTASRMESNGEALKIHVSETTHRDLEKMNVGYALERRGTIPIKGKGEMTTYWLLRKGEKGPFD